MSDVEKIGSAGIPLNIVDANGRKIIGDAYDNTATYAVGDYCISGDHAYKCTTKIETPEDFNTNHWQQITIEEIVKEHDASIESLNSSLTNLSNVVDGCITWRSKIMPDITMQANSTGSASLDLNTLAGYKPIGIVGYTGTGTTGTVMQECYMTSTYKAFVYLRNMTNAQKTVSSVTVNVLYIKDDII